MHLSYACTIVRRPVCVNDIHCSLPLIFTCQHDVGISWKWPLFCRTWHYNHYRSTSPFSSTSGPRETVFYYRATTLMAVRYHDYKVHYVTRSGFGLDPPTVSECLELLTWQTKRLFAVRAHWAACMTWWRKPMSCSFNDVTIVSHKYKSTHNLSCCEVHAHFMLTMQIGVCCHDWLVDSCYQVTNALNWRSINMGWRYDAVHLVFLFSLIPSTQLSYAEMS